MVIIIKYVVIDPSLGGSEIGVNGNGIVEKDFNLKISKYIYDRLKEENINVLLTRSEDNYLNIDDRINYFQNEFGKENDVIVISNRLNRDNVNGIEIIYALRDEDYLAEGIESFLRNEGFLVNDYYQLRDEENTNLDFEEIIRDSSDNETIIVSYGNIFNSDDLNNINNNWEKMAEAVVGAVLVYLGNTYNKEGYYTVGIGDTLYGIARKYGISVSELKDANGLDSNGLTIGQVLKIPKNNTDSGSNLNYINYVVSSGDSLYAISKKYNTTVDEIKRVNNLTTNNLSIGQNLKIPNSNSSNNNSNNLNNYVVKSGDSLYQIAKKYNTTVDEVKRVNNLSNNNLSIGQVLKIPNSVSDSSYINYIVVSGDSLYALARKYNTTVDEIKRINNLTSNSLSIGQSLKIPK